LEQLNELPLDSSSLLIPLPPSIALFMPGPCPMSRTASRRLTHVSLNFLDKLVPSKISFMLTASMSEHFSLKSLLSHEEQQQLRPFCAHTSIGQDTFRTLTTQRQAPTYHTLSPPYYSRSQSQCLTARPSGCLTSTSAPSPFPAPSPSKIMIAPMENQIRTQQTSARDRHSKVPTHPSPRGPSAPAFLSDPHAHTTTGLRSPRLRSKQQHPNPRITLSLNFDLNFHLN
jgi:hypothetical protein